MKDGGPAFPTSPMLDDSVPPVILKSGAGMSLRDYFAAAALQAIISKFPPIASAQIADAEFDAKLTAKGAYIYADAMLAERAKQ